MTSDPQTSAATEQIGGSDIPTVWQTVRRGLELSPELRSGLRITLMLAGLATIGRIVVPFAVQQTIDRGLLAPGGPRVQSVLWLLLGAAGVLVGTGLCANAVNRRLFQAAESGLASLRVAAFRHVHDLSVLTQNTERRGSLVSRVTSDVDTISAFVQFGGLMLILAIFQLSVATALMLWYSPLLTLVVWLCFLPVFLLAKPMQGAVSRAYTVVRERVGSVLTVVSESVVGAATIRAYGVQARTGQRVDQAVIAHRDAATSAQVRVAVAFSLGVLASGVAAVAVVVVGTWRGAAGELSLGQLLAFLFLVQLFTGPVQVGTEVLTELQNAVAGWRRVLGILDTPADIADPGLMGQSLPRGPMQVDFDQVSYAYPGGPTVLHGVDLSIQAGQRIAIVGETGSGKTTFAKLLARLMDPSAGQIRLDGVALPEISFSTLRERVVLVPQDGFLFDRSLLDNLRFAKPEATAEEVTAAMGELGLQDWLAGLPMGLATPVGQRGESLSAGERQLVALARAYLTNPDLLILDEATSSVDPATEVRIQRALDGLSRGRTSIAIAHRLSTAQAADEVLVVEAGVIVERGSAGVLIAADGAYARLHASWLAQQALDLSPD